ncbi:MAG TPA: PEP/pyruvate-binding domain-containing protein, partial [Malonomonas sp.]
EKYQRLAELVDAVTSPHDNPLRQAYQLGIDSEPPRVADTDQTEVEDWPQLSANIRFSRASQLLLHSRTELTRAAGNQAKLNWLDSSLDLEDELYRSANQLLNQLPTANRRQRLAWIEQGLDALYGIGFLSERQLADQQKSIETLLTEPLSAPDYQRELLQLSRISRWAENQLRFHFESSISHLTILDTKFNGFLQERLRASPLLPIALMIDSLLEDSQQLRGVKQRLFGRISAGLQPLNPGLARGRLELVSDPLQHKFKPDGIYLLPETVAELPPVAGILTRGAGNTLSHVQLLARNLGIPNLAISEQLLPELARHAGKIIVVAVSPGGVVQIEADSVDWQKRFDQQQSRTDVLIDPDLAKLDLQQQQILSLSEISASDSGRIAGPKGANLGELKQIYAQLVPDALVIPFGRFHQLLANSTAPDGQSLFRWMQSNYRRLEQLPASEEKQRQTAEFLHRLQQQIISAPLPDDFLTELQAKLARQFGPDGSFGVFVRSDTNVEDLPNFTGAGLNRTVPHVVGFRQIVAAIREVWASPFNQRAYGWRQAHMRAPEHVYASVLLMLSVPAEKSGVMATSDLLGGDGSRIIHVATNEGVGGAVNGQRAEELRIDRLTGEVRLLAQASAEHKRILLPTGGIRKVAAAAPQQLLSDSEIQQLIAMAELLPKQFPALRDKQGQVKPADIEFGFLDGNFVLFQIRPLLESSEVKKDLYLAQLDAAISTKRQYVELSAIPLEP